MNRHSQPWSARTACAVLAAALAFALLPFFTGCTACTGKPPMIKVPEVEAIEVSHGALGWHGILIGMTAADVSRAIGTPIDPEGLSESGCDGPMASVKVAGHAADLYFTGSGPDAKVNGIFVPLNWRRTKGALVRSLKHRVPELVYQPSRFEPGLVETKNPTPVYVFGQTNRMAVLVKPDEKGFWLSLEECLD